MAIRIDGTNTTANPGLTGADTDTGLQLGTDELKLVTGGSEAVTVDSSQNVGIGTSSPGSLLELEKNGATQLRMTRTNTVSNYCQIKAAGNNSEQLTITTDPTGQGSGFIAFENSGSECMRILSSGGLTFNGDTATANALDDYEEGTFTPTLTDATSYLTQAGYYTKVGRLVTFCLRVQPNAASPSASAVEIGGLPFTNVSISSGPYGGAFRSYGLLVNESSINNLNFHMPTNNNVIRPLSNGSLLATNNSAVNVIGNFIFNGFYYTAS